MKHHIEESAQALADVIDGASLVLDHTPDIDLRDRDVAITSLIIEVVGEALSRTETHKTLEPHHFASIADAVLWPNGTIADLLRAAITEAVKESTNQRETS